ncbi:flavin monoamine oxidase family protein [Planctobacterium marinum]|uniref:Amine oxidase domain-containing protein n=1 Tax=Planctobacterium marinum TaxID=1631968 RepID=A0AA48HI98_9ALTE|nr:hypothetical protein MACH26_07070 [Planctobacterium marinum]
MIDNLIIGGGLAGLFCAFRLQQQGENFLLLEASAQSGGRIQPASENCAIDAGPTWFWPHQLKMQALTQELQVDVFEQYIDGDTLFQPAEPHAPIQKMHYQQGTSFRIKGGITLLINALQAQLLRKNLRFSSQVKALEKIDNGWQVLLNNNEKVRSRRLFLALPPRMIVKHLTPKSWLSENAITHMQQQQTWMSAQAKYIAIFETSFWREYGLSGFAISHRGPLVEIHDAVMPGQTSALFGFVGLDAQQRKDIPSEDLKAACRQQLLSIYGKQAVPTSDHLMDWSNNPYICSMADIGESPLHNHVNLQQLYQNEALPNLYFVGSEFSQSEPGYLEGALDAVDSALQLIDIS